MLVSFLEQMYRDKSLRGSVGGRVVGYILASWTSLSSWWGAEFVADRRLAIVDILKKMFSLDPEVCMCVYQCVCMCVSMCVCIKVCVCINVGDTVSMCVYQGVCVSMCMCVSMPAFISATVIGYIYTSLFSF